MGNGTKVSCYLPPAISGQSVGKRF
uniref:Uncharacterized protein n=1 Tax=Rhizophora mucronata TaxID=61149 RepID=A0A2P2N8Q3_RHIMU